MDEKLIKKLKKNSLFKEFKERTFTLDDNTLSIMYDMKKVTDIMDLIEILDDRQKELLYMLIEDLKNEK